MPRRIPIPERVALDEAVAIEREWVQGIGPDIGPDSVGPDPKPNRKIILAATHQVELDARLVLLALFLSGRALGPSTQVRNLSAYSVNPIVPVTLNLEE